MKRLGPHRLKTQWPQHEIHLWSMSVFYVAINFKVLEPESQEGSSHTDTPKLALPYALGFSGSLWFQSARLTAHPLCVWEVGWAFSPQVQLEEQKEQEGWGPPTAHHAGALWGWWGLCPRLGLGRPGRGGACAHA